jgi:hypothetical protein
MRVVMLREQLRRGRWDVPLRSRHNAWPFATDRCLYRCRFDESVIERDDRLSISGGRSYATQRHSSGQARTAISVYLLSRVPRDWLAAPYLTSCGRNSRPGAGWCFASFTHGQKDAKRLTCLDAAEDLGKPAERNMASSANEGAAAPRRSRVRLAAGRVMLNTVRATRRATPSRDCRH